VSHKMLPKPTSTLVCDLCGEPIETYSNDDRANLAWGVTPFPATTKPRHWMLRWSNFRNPGAPPIPANKIDWDFHGVCLVRALAPLVGGAVPASAHPETEASHG
jgi:hypothetical protein